MVGQCAGGYMEYGGGQFAADLVHIGDHQQQTLGCGEGGGQSAGGQRAVNSTCSTCFRLHFGNANGLAEQVGAAIGGPFIRYFCHGRRGSDGENSCHIAECICDMADSGIAVTSHLDAQWKNLLL